MRRRRRSIRRAAGDGTDSDAGNGDRQTGRQCRAHLTLDAVVDLRPLPPVTVHALLHSRFHRLSVDVRGFDEDSDNEVGGADGRVKSCAYFELRYYSVVSLSEGQRLF